MPARQQLYMFPTLDHAVEVIVIYSGRRIVSFCLRSFNIAADLEGKAFSLYRARLTIFTQRVTQKVTHLP